MRDSKNQDNTVIAGIDLDRDELTVEVNSTERSAELQALIAGARAMGLAVATIA